MARGAFNNANYLWHNGAVVAGAPYTFSLWVYPLAAANGAPLGIDNAADDNRAMIFLWADRRVCSYVKVGATYSIAYAASNYTLNAWNHIACVRASTTSNFCYLNGTPGTEEISDRTPAGLAYTGLGALRYGVAATYGFNGYVAEPAIYNAGLTPDQVTALAGGVEPSMIRRANLVAAWRCTPGAGNETDILGTYDLTEVGTVAHQTHPPVRRAQTLANQPGQLVAPVPGRWR